MSEEYFLRTFYHHHHHYHHYNYNYSVFTTIFPLFSTSATEFDAQFVWNFLFSIFYFTDRLFGWHFICATNFLPFLLLFKLFYLCPYSILSRSLHCAPQHQLFILFILIIFLYCYDVISTVFYHISIYFQYFDVFISNFINIYLVHISSLFNVHLKPFHTNSLLSTNIHFPTHLPNRYCFLFIGFFLWLRFLSYFLLMSTYLTVILTSLLLCCLWTKCPKRWQLHSTRPMYTMNKYS